MEFWLIQRIVRNIARKGPIAKMADLHLERMVPSTGENIVNGAEFKAAQLARANEAMQKLPLSIQRIVVRISDKEVVIYCLAPTDQAPTLQSRFQDWIDAGFFTQQYPQFREVALHETLTGRAIDEEVLDRAYPHAWWALEERIVWSLNEEIVKIWLEGGKTLKFLE